MKKKTEMRRRRNKPLIILVVLVLFASFLLSCSSDYATNGPSKEDSSLEDVASLVPKLLPVDTVLKSKGGTYSGPAIGSVYSGSGEFLYNSGGTYVGEFAESKREGIGTFTWENGDSFTGKWKNDFMANGTYTFADGRSFVGEFRNNSFWNGTYTVESIPAKLKLKSFSAKYVSGKVDAVCLTTSKGTKYDGQITGKATIEYATGNKYIGEVKEGVRNGQGKYYWVKKGKTVAFYDGAWLNGKMDGQGSYHYSEKQYPYVKGVFVNGKLDGEAIYYKDVGNTFTTTWKKGVCKKVK